MKIRYFAVAIMCLSFAVAGPVQAGKFKGCTGTYLLEIDIQGYPPVGVLHFSDDGTVVGQTEQPNTGDAGDVVGNWSTTGSSGIKAEFFDVSSWESSIPIYAATLAFSLEPNSCVLRGTISWFAGTGNFEDAQPIIEGFPLRARPFAQLPAAD